MLEALMNPVILDHIFAKLSLPDLKTSRLVCQEWDDVASSLLGMRTFINVDKLFHYDGSHLHQTTSLNDKLKRHILISGVLLPRIPENKIVDMFAQMITQVLNSSQVIEIQFTVTRKEFAIGFLKGIENVQTTNIQHVSILISKNESTLNNEYPVEEYPKLPIQVNLSLIKLVCPDSRDEILPVYENFFQILIDSAPNLTSLTMSGTFYPNLESCKKLKVLEFNFRQYSHVAPIKLNLNTLTRILAQVKDSLIEMKFSYIGNENVDFAKDKIPVMSELTSLTIYYTNLFRLFIFDEDHLPKLKNLTFAKSHLGEWNYLNVWQRHRGVQYLNLHCDNWPVMSDEFFRTVVQLFPAVKKFNFRIWIYCGNSIHKIKNIIEPFASWELTEANVEVQRAEQSSVIVEFVKNMENWKGFKRVKFNSTQVKYDDFSPQIPNLIRYGRGFKSVEISGDKNSIFHDPECLELMRPTFEACGAPIYITGGIARH